jgi:hypothetical protein
MTAINKTDGVWDALLGLRALTETTGVLHEAQKLQLQMWGPMLLPHAADIEVGVQLPWTENEGLPTQLEHDVRIIEFRVIETTGRAPKNLQKRLKTLDEWVKRLLGSRFAVRVLVRGKLIFEGRGKSPKKKTND